MLTAISTSAVDIAISLNLMRFLSGFFEADGPSGCDRLSSTLIDTVLSTGALQNVRQTFVHPPRSTAALGVEGQLEAPSTQ